MAAIDMFAGSAEDRALERGASPALARGIRDTVLELPIRSAGGDPYTYTIPTKAGPIDLSLDQLVDYAMNALNARAPEGGVFAEPSRSTGGSRKPGAGLGSGPDRLARQMMAMNPGLFASPKEAKRVVAEVLKAIRAVTSGSAAHPLGLRGFGTFAPGGRFNPRRQWGKGLRGESFRDQVNRESARRGILQEQDLLTSIGVAALQFVTDLLSQPARYVARKLRLVGEDPEQVKAAVEVIAQDAEENQP